MLAGAPLWEWRTVCREGTEEEEEEVKDPLSILLIGH